MNLKVLFDTNEVISCAVNRDENFSILGKFFNMVVDEKIDGYLTSHSLVDFFYITRKDLSLETRKNFVMALVNNFTILTESNQIFRQALLIPELADLEDCLQMQCADEAFLDFIVTENINDFKNSQVKAINAQEFLKVIAA